MLKSYVSVFSAPGLLKLQGVDDDEAFFDVTLSLEDARVLSDALSDHVLRASDDCLDPAILGLLHSFVDGLKDGDMDHVVEQLGHRSAPLVDAVLALKQRLRGVKA